MKAKYGSNCGVCGQWINVGDEQFEMASGAWRHEHCAEPTDEGSDPEATHVETDQQSWPEAELQPAENAMTDDEMNHDETSGQSALPDAPVSAAVNTELDGETQQAPTTDAPRVSAPPALPANATREDLRRWLKAMDEDAINEKRERYLANVRAPRSKLIEEMFAHLGIAPVEGDRSETKRLAQLREHVIGSADGKPEAVVEPTWFDAAKSERVRFTKKR